ncbi:unnamed protein product [Prunus armeniaca]|uniref:Uncharacterized protein n=1 Tax=Prunus armeniaca TaxID=36596 RepID=A0A6J5TWG3_PRUAR|nr:unnamed protein product [Prunus armeniaca]
MHGNFQWLVLKLTVSPNNVQQEFKRDDGGGDGGGGSGGGGENGSGVKIN